MSLIFLKPLDARAVLPAARHVPIAGLRRQAGQAGPILNDHDPAPPQIEGRHTGIHASAPPPGRPATGQAAIARRQGGANTCGDRGGPFPLLRQLTVRRGCAE